ncbi:MAG: CPBP family intramembrane glutamic endopeptidase [Pseudomonadota bacterium]
MGRVVTSNERVGRPGSAAAGAWVDLAIVLALGALLMGFNTSEAAGGDLVARLIVPGRMLLICLVATVLLARRGETWGAVGAAWPSSIPRTALLVVGGYLAVGAVAAAVTALVFPALGIASKAAGALPGLKGDPAEYAYWLAVSWSSAALGEELLFRGFIAARLRRALGGAAWAGLAAVVGQAALFGLAHAYQGAGGALLAGGAGLVLGGVWLAGRRNLAACMILHALIDTISLTAVFLGAVPGAA